MGKLLVNHPYSFINDNELGYKLISLFGPSVHVDPFISPQTVSEKNKGCVVPGNYQIGSILLHFER